MNKCIVSLFLILFGSAGLTQSITAFSDANGKLYQFNKGQIKIVEYQTTKNLQVGNNYIAYSNTQNDYWVIWQGNKMKIAQGYTKFCETNNMLVAQFTSILKVVDHGEIKTLTSFVNSFSYGDSLVVFQDNIGGNLKYYYQDTVVEFAQIIGNYIFTDEQVGSNVFAYGDNAGNYFDFQNHQFYPLFSANNTPKFSAGLNVIAYNDFENNSFTVFNNGQIIDIENQYAMNYQAGHNFVYYQDQSETHKVYYKENIMDA